MNISLLNYQVTKVGLWKYESHTTLGVAPCPVYVCCLPCAWVGLESYVEKKLFASYSFDSISGAHESKERYLQTLHFVPLTTRAPVPNDVEILQPKVGLGPNQIKIDLRKMFQENITLFMNKISYFWKIKTKESLRHVQHPHVCACKLKLYIRMLHA